MRARFGSGRRRELQRGRNLSIRFNEGFSRRGRWESFAEQHETRREGREIAFKVAELFGDAFPAFPGPEEERERNLIWEMDCDLRK